MDKKTGVIHWLTKLKNEALYSYLAIFAGCGLAMVMNLAAQGVGLSALAEGSMEERGLVFLTLAVVSACAAGMVLLFLAIRRKQDR